MNFLKATLEQQTMSAAEHTDNQRRWVEAFGTATANGPSMRCYQLWVTRNPAYAASLQELVDSLRAECYEDLLRRFDPDLTESMVEAALVSKSLPSESATQVAKIHNGFFPADTQIDFLRAVAADLGFDFRRGVLAAGPFSGSLNCGDGDVRISVKIDERDLRVGICGGLHEIGHALLDQNNRATLEGYHPAVLASAVVHEGVARYFEDYIGKSERFWFDWFPRLAEMFSVGVNGMALSDWLRYLNQPENSLCRVRTSWQNRLPHYRLRFDLERQLIDGSIVTSDLPKAWDEACVRHFGRKPRTLEEGWMQDPHWALGIFGYLPAYAVADELAQRMATNFRDHRELIAALRDEILSLVGVDSLLSATLSYV